MMETKTELCACISWAREASMTLTEHHQKCPKAWPPEALRLINELVVGLSRWAADCDGIHADAWGAYVEARAAIGRPLTAKELADAAE